MGNEQEKENYFAELNSINVKDKTEKKNGLTYLSWAWAWGELKKQHPDATYTIYENADGLFYHHDGKTAWVKTGVTVNGIEHIEYLPVMDYKNQSIPLDKITSVHVNKTIQRSLTKAVARHGLGLYIYAGEDIPEDEKEAQAREQAEKKQAEKGQEHLVQAEQHGDFSIPGYPDRQTMLDAIYPKYPRGSSNYIALIAAIGVDDLDHASDAQLAHIYGSKILKVTKG